MCKLAPTLIDVIHIIKTNFIPLWYETGHSPIRRKTGSSNAFKLVPKPLHASPNAPHPHPAVLILGQCADKQMEELPLLKADKKHNSLTKWVGMKIQNMFTFIRQRGHQPLVHWPLLKLAMSWHASFYSIKINHFMLIKIQIHILFL